MDVISALVLTGILLAVVAGVTAFAGSVALTRTAEKNLYKISSVSGLGSVLFFLAAIWAGVLIY